MNDDIRRLVRLQDIAFQIREIEEVDATLPNRIADIEREFQQRIEEIGAARLRHESLVQQQRRLNQEREDQQNRLKQAQSRLMQVNNPREYSAVLNEIDTYKSTVSGLEERILDSEGQIEQLSGPAAEADAHIAEERQRMDAEKNTTREAANANRAKLDALMAQRQEIASQLPPDVLRRFESLFRARGGIAMARVEKESCSACHVRLRPQVINLARRGDDLITCDSCRRILYVDDSEPDTASGGQDVAENRRAEAGS